jgi:hypothetical protein
MSISSFFQFQPNTFILLHKLLQIWLSGALAGWLLCLLRLPLFSFSALPNFLALQDAPGSPCVFLHGHQNQAVSPRSPVHFTEEQNWRDSGHQLCFVLLVCHCF